MRDDADTGVDSNGRVVWVGWKEGDDVLYDEEEEGNDHSYFGSWEKNLNEEILDDKYDVKKDEDYERDVEGYVC